MRHAFLTALLVLAGCGDPVDVTNSVTGGNEVEAKPMVPQARPVRVGELGPNFAACNAAGTTRHLKAAETLPVRSSPFDNSPENGAIAAGARFFVCTASLDRKWLGIVFDEGGALAERCGVSAPVRARRDYAGPCRSGWVQSAFVKLIAGTDQPVPAPAGSTGATNEPVPAPAGA